MTALRSRSCSRWSGRRTPRATLPARDLTRRSRRRPPRTALLSRSRSRGFGRRATAAALRRRSSRKRSRLSFLKRLDELVLGDLLIAVAVGTDQELLEPLGGAGRDLVRRDYAIVVGIESVEEHFGVGRSRPSCFACRRDLRQHDDGPRRQ